jgi:DNA topoisomerase-1
VLRSWKASNFKVIVEKKPVQRTRRRRSSPQRCNMEASRKLGFGAVATPCALAQRLYEGVDIGGETVGLITYMRTDGIDPERRSDRPSPRRHLVGLRRRIPCPRSPRQYSAKAKNAQEAHEAIRPTDSKRHASHGCAISGCRCNREFYELIWKRTVASQMERPQNSSAGREIDMSKRRKQAGICAPTARSIEVRRFPQGLFRKPRRR